MSAAGAPLAPHTPGLPPFGQRNLPIPDARLVGLTFQLLAGTVKEGALDSRNAVVAELGELLTEKGVDTRIVFNVVYLAERTALDETVADDAFDGKAQSWPVVAQMVRRASFDVCSAFTEYLSRDMALAAIVERIGITIRNYFRDTDWVARTAGDAFGVILPEIQRVDAVRIADRAGISMD